MRFLCDRKRHLVCEPFSVENLHLMARVLRIGRHWFHGGRLPHYDIPKRRIAEITARCVVISSRELLGVIKGAPAPIAADPSAESGVRMPRSKQIQLRWGTVELDLENDVLSGKTLDGVTFQMTGVTDLMLHRWMDGEYVQNVFPHLSPGERETLISGYSSAAFDDMFADDASESDDG